MLAVAYYEPVTATDRTWELTMIGVRRDLYRQGREAELLQHVKDDLRCCHLLALLQQEEDGDQPVGSHPDDTFTATGHDLTGSVATMAT